MRSNVLKLAILVLGTASAVSAYAYPGYPLPGSDGHKVAAYPGYPLPGSDGHKVAAYPGYPLPGSDGR
jgi:hypothetical protein